MKRKVKFQEGGAVEEPSPRNRQLRTMMEKRGREGRRVGLAERARERELARRREATERRAAQRDVERMNPGQGAAEAERRAGRAVPERAPDFTTDERGTTRRGAAAGREVVAAPQAGMPSRFGGQAMLDNVTPRQMPLGSPRVPVGGNLAALAATTGVSLAEPLVNYGRRFAERRGEEAAARRDLNLLSMRARTADAEGGDIAADAERQRQEAARPAPRSAPRPRPRTAPAPARRELTMEEIRALRSGARAPRTSEERALREGLRDLPQPQQRMSEADMLNERELQRIRAERMAEEQMGGSGNIGAASARERGEQVGPTGDYNMKKGGMVPSPKAVVKKKAGGRIAAKSKKGGAVAKPKGKAMPFKKGGKVAMKGKK